MIPINKKQVSPYFLMEQFKQTLMKILQMKFLIMKNRMFQILSRKYLPNKSLPLLNLKLNHLKVPTQLTILIKLAAQIPQSQRKGQVTLKIQIQLLILKIVHNQIRTAKRSSNNKNKIHHLLHPHNHQRHLLNNLRCL